ncbi:MAG: hypothetical protein RLZZ127_1078, partial [Planctomycetota bacterium]
MLDRMADSARHATAASARHATASGMRLQETPSPSVWSVVGPLIKPWRWPLAGAVALNAFHGFAITFQVFTVGWLVDWVL